MLHTQAYLADMTHINYMLNGMQPIVSCFWLAENYRESAAQ
jgi:hypothetical protein